MCFFIVENTTDSRRFTYTKKVVLWNSKGHIYLYKLTVDKTKDFLKSIDPIKEVVYPELPPLDIPGAEEIKEGQLELF